MKIQAQKHDFVIGCYRNSIDAKLPKKIQEEKIKTALDDSRFIGPSCALLRSSDYVHIIAGDDNGYALGETVRSNVEGAWVIWIDWIDEDKAAVVVINAGQVSVDGLYEKNGDNLYILQGIEEEAYEIVSNGEVPSDLDDQINQESNRRIEEGRLINGLVLNEEYHLVSFEEAFSRLHPHSNAPAAIIAVGVIAVIGLMIIMLSGEEEQTVEQVDHYAEYRQVLSSPSATVSLIELHRTAESMLFIEGWVFEECSYTTSRVDCRLSPAPGANRRSIEELSENISRTVNYKFVDQFVELTLSTNEMRRVASDVIVPVDETVPLLWESIFSSIYPTSISVLEKEQFNLWGHQMMVVKKDETTIDSLLLLAEQTRGLPVRLQSAKITRAAHALNVEVDLKTFGLM